MLEVLGSLLIGAIIIFGGLTVVEHILRGTDMPDWAAFSLIAVALLLGGGVSYALMSAVQTKDKAPCVEWVETVSTTERLCRATDGGEAVCEPMTTKKCLKEER